MQTLEKLQNYFQAEGVEITQKIINRNAVVNEAYNSYLCTISVYLDRFSEIPNQLCIEEIDTTKAIEFLQYQYATNIVEEMYSKSYVENNTILVLDYYFFLYEDLMLYFSETDKLKIYFKHTPEKKVFELLEALQSIKKVLDVSKPKMNVVTNGFDGLTITELEIDAPEIDFELNYNQDFLAVNEVIREKMKADNAKGLVLLHGKPGTGKTTYIRHLIATINKRIIFVPTGMAAYITQPALLALLMKYKNSVLVIEDSETLIADRELQDSPVAALLNITDGLLSDALKIQVICSFNTELSKIDKALLRKGRLIARYEFLELSVDKANCLAQKLALNKRFDEPCILAEIYNAKDSDYGNVKAQTKIGFKF